MVSDQAWQASWNLAVTASAAAAVACIGTWTTDFRAGLPTIDVPVLVLHGDADQVLLDKTGKRLPGLINDMQLTVEKDLYNSRQPVNDVDNYLQPWSKILENGGYPPKRPKRPPCSSCPTTCATPIRTAANPSTSTATATASPG